MSTDLRCQTAYGYDVVLAIDPSVYEVSRTGGGVDYAFQVTEKTKKRLATVLRDTFDHAKAVERFEVHPGYIRVQVNMARLHQEVDPKDVATPLSQLAGEYNERYATDGDADLDGLKFRDQYFGVYQPEDTPDRESFTDQQIGSDAAPSHDGPVFEFEREPMERARRDDRHLEYEYVLSLDEKMYTGAVDNALASNRPAFEWRDVVRDQLTKVVEDRSLWTSGDVTRVEIHPEHVYIRHLANTTYHSPEHLASECIAALSRYNRYRPPLEETASSGSPAPLSPPIRFRDVAYVGVPESVASGAETYIEAEGLDDVDGEPREPTIEEPPSVDADSGDDGFWHAFSGWR